MFELAEILGDLTHWSSLAPLGACVVLRLRGSDVGTDAWLFCLAFVTSWGADIIGTVVRIEDSNRWVSWMFVPFESVLFSFSVNRTPMAIVMFLVTAGIADAVLLQTGAITLADPPLIMSTLGWASVAIYAAFWGNRSPIIRKGVVLYSAAIGGMYLLFRDAFPDHVMRFWIGWIGFQSVKLAVLYLFFVELGLLRIPSKGLALLSMGRSLNLDQGKIGRSRREVLLEELSSVLEQRLRLCPDELQAELWKFVREPSSIVTVGVMILNLRMDRRSIERAHEEAGLPTPLRFQKLVQLAHAHAVRTDHLDSTFESIAQTLNTDVRTLRRSAESLFGVGLSEFFTKIRLSEVVATMVYPERSIRGKRRDSGGRRAAEDE